MEATLSKTGRGRPVPATNEGMTRKNAGCKRGTEEGEDGSGAAQGAPRLSAGRRAEATEAVGSVCRGNRGAGRPLSPGFVHPPAGRRPCESPRAACAFDLPRRKRSVRAFRANAPTNPGGGKESETTRTRMAPSSSAPSRPPRQQAGPPPAWAWVRGMRRAGHRGSGWHETISGRPSVGPAAVGRPNYQRGNDE